MATSEENKSLAVQEQIANSSMEMAVFQMNSDTLQNSMLTTISDTLLGIQRLLVEQANAMDMAARNANLAANAPSEGGVAAEKFGLRDLISNMVNSVQDAFDSMSGGTKGLLGLAALSLILLKWGDISDALVKTFGPILEFFDKTLIPNLQELHQIIMDSPAGYFTLLGAAGLTSAIFAQFGIGGKIGKLFTGTAQLVRDVFNPKTLMLRQNSKTWKYKMTQAVSGKNGIIKKVSRSFTRLSRAVRRSGTVVGFKNTLLSARTGWQAGLRGALVGSGGGPAGAGKAGGVIGKLSGSFGSMTNAVRTAGATLGTGTTKALSAVKLGWVSRLSGSLFGAGTGVISKVTGALGKVATTVTGIFTPSSALGRFTKAIKGVFKIISTALGFVSKLSGLGSFLKLGLSLGKAIPIVGQVIMVLTGIFGFITGAIKGFKTGGIMGAIKGGLIGLYDGLVGSFLNLIADLIGWVFKKLGFERVGEFFSNMNFNFDGIMNGVYWVLDKLQFLFHSYVNGLKHMANLLIKGANLLLPKRWEIEEFVIEPYESKKREPVVTEAEAFDVGTIPSQGVQTRAEFVETDVKALAASATMGMENQVIDVKPEFADIVPVTVSEEEATRRLQAIQGENQELSNEADEAMRLYQEAISDAGTTTIIDSSTKSQLNNTTAVSNAFRVDASDLVAAKLNQILSFSA